MVRAHFHPYSRAGTESSTDDGDSKKCPKEKKRVKEKQSRGSVNQIMGLLERSMIEKCPNLPSDMNWKRLTPANVGSKDRRSAEAPINPTPLKHKKVHVLNASVLMHDQDEFILQKAMERLASVGEAQYVERLSRCRLARCTPDAGDAFQKL